MFSFTSWISEPRSSDKILNGELESKMFSASRPVVEIPLAGVVPKRKRSISVEAPDTLPQIPVTTNEIKRRKVLPAKTDVPVIKAATESCEKSKVKAVVNNSRVRDTIEAQFSLEILLKHKEMRLIDQELAKCQIALEQLRRCHLIPYPTAQATPESMLHVSNGTGPALARGGNVPRWAPAHGVVDGPYTRHYSKWLIPDSTFDGMQSEWQRDMSRAGKSLPEGRSTRYSIGDGMGSHTKSRNQRGSQGQKLQALSNGYPVEKAKVGPCVLKRNDGQTVKLVCIDCNRENFSSTQGFINHCRIAHKREFKSHEEAATVSGQPYEGEEAIKLIAEEKIVPMPVPTPTTSSTSGLVHPLVRSAPADPEAYKSLLLHIDAGRALFEQGRLPGVTSIPTSAVSSPIKPTPTSTSSGRINIVPSAATPRLSAWLGNKEWSGDLAKIVDDATTKIDFDDISSQDGDSDGELHPVLSAHLGLQAPETPLHTMRMPARAAMSPVPNRPASSKGISPRLTHATPVINTSITHFDRSSRGFNEVNADNLNTLPEGNIDLEMMDGPSITDLSPNTVSSNNAPSLVSDDGEYDEGDDAESAASGEDDVESVAEIDIADDCMDKVVPRAVLQNRAVGRGGNGMSKEDKHVTFMSPVKDGKQVARRN